MVYGLTDDGYGKPAHVMDEYPGKPVPYAENGYIKPLSYIKDDDGNPIPRIEDADYLNPIPLLEYDRIPIPWYRHRGHNLWNYWFGIRVPL